jgi:hypothetical protein
MSKTKCPSAIGAQNEYLVVCDLLRQSFRVFKNVAFGPVDLIATKRGLILRVQVKSVMSRSALRGNDVLAVVASDGRIRYRARTRRIAKKFENS